MNSILLDSIGNGLEGKKILIAWASLIRILRHPKSYECSDTRVSESSVVKLHMARVLNFYWEQLFAIA